MTKTKQLAAIFAAMAVALSTGFLSPPKILNAEDGDIAIDEINFPDENFRACVSAVAIDSNGDGVLTLAEREAVTTLYAINRNISDLTGIEHFTKLKSLNCSNNQLTDLDVSSCTALIDLNCSNNQLTSLNTSGCSALEFLNCYDNQITALDISDYPALKALYCGGDQLASLNIRNSSALEELYCHDSPALNTLEVSGCTKLKRIQCLYNALKTLNVNNCPALTHLNCTDNQITNLDIGNCLALINLDCSDNQLTDLDIGNCPALACLYCHNNKLEALDVSSCTALIDLYCNNNHLTSLDVSSCTALINLDCSNNQLTSLDVSSCSNMRKFNASNNVYEITASCGGTYDLSKLTEVSGFNAEKASDWSGGTIDGTTLTIDENATVITYTYDCGNNKTAVFTLKVVAGMTHDKEFVAEVPATCTEDGNKAHYVCNDCEAFFDENGAEINEEDLVIPATGHNAGEWKFNETHHWKECTVCGELLEDTKEAHRDIDGNEACGACEYPMPKEPEETTPEETTPEPEVTTPEPEVTTPEPEETTPEPEITTPEVTTPMELVSVPSTEPGRGYGVIVETKPPQTDDVTLGAGVEETTKDSGIIVVAVLGIMTVLGTAIAMRKKSKR